MAGPGLPGTVSPPPFHPIPPLGKPMLPPGDQPELQASNAIPSLSVTHVDPSGLFFIDSVPKPDTPCSTVPDANTDVNMDDENYNAPGQVDEMHPSRRAMMASGTAQPDEPEEDFETNLINAGNGHVFVSKANCTGLGVKEAITKPVKMTKKQRKILANRRPNPGPQQLSKKGKRRLKAARTDAERKAQAGTEKADTTFFYAKIIEEKQTNIHMKEEELCNSRDENRCLRRIVEGLGFPDVDVEELIARLKHGQTVMDALQQIRSK